MPLDFNNPFIIRFLKENYESENTKRLLWFIKNKDEISKGATFGAKYKGYSIEDVQRYPMEFSLPSLTLQHQTSYYNRRKKVSRDGPILGISKTKRLNKHGISQELSFRDAENDLTPEPKMKPIEPNVSKILYGTVPDGGRRKYLNVRKQIIPEDKYYFCETSNNVLGWGLADSSLVNLDPHFGRCYYLNRDVMSRSGPQPDPPYYKSPSDFINSKCNSF